MDLASITLTPLEPGQRTVLHIRAIVPTVLMMVIGVGAGLVLHDRLGWQSWPFVVIACLIAFWMLMSRINVVSLSQSWLQRRLGLATVVIDTAGGGWFDGPNIHDLKYDAARLLVDRLRTT